MFDGFTDVGQGNPQSITIDGFLAPRAGPVDAQVGLVAYEGDYSATGDTAQLGGTLLGTALSPSNNYFNGTEDALGSSVTARNPSHLNNLGFDIKSVGAGGIIPNSATSETINLDSRGDRYFPGVVTTAINLFAPDFSPSTKTVVDLAGNDPAVVGDELSYTLTYTNIGQDPAGSAVLDRPVAGRRRVRAGFAGDPVRCGKRGVDRRRRRRSWRVLGRQPHGDSPAGHGRHRRFRWHDRPRCEHPAAVQGDRVPVGGRRHGDQWRRSLLPRRDPWPGLRVLGSAGQHTGRAIGRSGGDENQHPGSHAGR